MRVKRGRARLSGLAAAVAVVALAFGGCAAGTPERSIVVIDYPLPTPPPTDTPTPVPTPTSALEPSASAGPTSEATDSGPGSSALPPVSYKTCTVRGALDQAFWSKAAKAVDWDAYCPVLPSAWIVLGGTYHGSAGGEIDMSWRGPAGARIDITEGAFCTTDPDTCSPHASVIGPVTLGDQPGSLDALSDGGLAVYVSPGTGKAYRLTGSGISQAAFVAIAAAVVKVARP